MKKLLAVAIVAVMGLAAVPGYAATERAAGTLSVIEFSNLPENRGVSGRMLDRRYEEYRQGRVPQTTLDVSNIR